MRSKRSRINASAPLPDDELDFVDSDLLTLAAQLGSEANYLATVYPPKDGVLEDCQEVALRDDRRQSAPKRTWQRVTRLASACAVVAVAIAFAVHLPSSPVNSFKNTAPWQPSPSVSQSPTVPGNFDLIPADTSATMPVMFVSELSDPELDAWLDLRQNNTDERIAF